MKKFVACCLLGLMFISPADALPGWDPSQVKTWIKEHKFLSPYYFEEDGMFYVITAYRQLLDDHFVDLDIVFSGFDDLSFEETLAVTKRKFNPELETNGYDKRKWENLGPLDIWSRENAVAQELLAKIYGVQIKDDFKNSKLVYSGGDYHEDGLGTDCPRCEINPKSSYPLVQHANVELFFGKLWAYEHIQTEYGDKKLVLYSLKRGKGELKTLLLNAELYSSFSKRKTEEKSRLEPADIKIN